jgi:hypothetical protein
MFFEQFEMIKKDVIALGLTTPEAITSSFCVYVVCALKCTHLYTVICMLYVATIT